MIKILSLTPSLFQVLFQLGPDYWVSLLISTLSGFMENPAWMV